MTATLTGRTIVKVRVMTPAEIHNLGWPPCPYRPAGGVLTEYVALDLDDGSTLYASQDTAGNGPAVIFRLDQYRYDIVHLVQS